MQRSVDHHLKLTFYGPDGAFQTLLIMGAQKANRRQFSEQILNLLKLLSGRSLT
jgi:hypothetical protein